MEVGSFACLQPPYLPVHQASVPEGLGEVPKEHLEGWLSLSAYYVGCYVKWYRQVSIIGIGIFRQKGGNAQKIREQQVV